MLTFDPWSWHDDFFLISAASAFSEKIVLELSNVHVALLLILLLMVWDVALIGLIFRHEVVEADL